MVVLLALLAACLAGCAGRPTSAATTPGGLRPPPGPNVSIADFGSAMAAARSGGGDPRRVEVLRIAMKELGKKYAWGGNGPDTWDCSGLVKHTYAQVGVDLPRVTYDQVKEGKEIKKEDLLPGDLLFFHRNGHVGIYIDNGLMIHAVGKVKVEKFSKSSRFLSAVRRVLLQPAGSGTGSGVVAMTGSLWHGMDALGFLVRGGGPVFFDGVPYDTGADFGLPFLWTYLINLGLFFLVATVVFLAAKEFEAFKRVKSMVPYGLITVALGIPIDILFLFIAGHFYSLEWGTLITNLRYGFPLEKSLAFLLIPSVAALVLLFFVQVILFRVFFKEIAFRNAWIMSAWIAFLTLPTWGTLVILATHHWVSGG
jgi:hypothetical protein